MQDLDPKKLNRLQNHLRDKDLASLEQKEESIEHQSRMCDILERQNDVLEAIKDKKDPEYPEFPTEMSVSLKGVSVVSIKGNKGDKGDKGDRGDKGQDGKNGLDGKNGKDGYNGQDGLNGKDGKDGTNGKDGEVAKIDIEELLTIKKRLSELDGRINMALQNPVRVVGGSGGGKGVDVLDEQSPISQNPMQKINFSGAGVTVTNLGNGVATVTIPGGAGTFYTETPNGDINGSNKSYTVLRTINTIFSFAINGTFIHPDEYSTTGDTITFSTALSADLSGTNFTIIYA